uniref:Uncharacterized protein n=1 Tax=Meloidogyne enterolobii TaxID=390850 RepID=A0A6V7WTZ9_MELEN|nr:unnamed protein product [Meloidogyne enterolobii]
MSTFDVMYLYLNRGLWASSRVLSGCMMKYLMLFGGWSRAI